MYKTEIKFAHVIMVMKNVVHHILDLEMMTNRNHD